jgi:hypothetical protein
MRNCVIHLCTIVSRQDEVVVNQILTEKDSFDFQISISALGKQATLTFTRRRRFVGVAPAPIVTAVWPAR